jgi:4-hydroxybenzoate polyprenyltransferase
LEKSPSIALSFRVFAADIKLAHSVFALPFAVAALVIGRVPMPTVTDAVLLVVCMVAARSFAMGMNRYLDREIDAQNPRTQRRKIPGGELAPAAALGWSLAAAAVFLVASFNLSTLAGYCAGPTLLLLASYSLLKRVTWVTHWYLGLCLGFAPVAVQIALTGAVTLPVVLLGLAVCLWTAGFDILYSLQDLEFDRSAGLHSVPGRFGPGAALALSRASFIGMIASLAGVGLLTGRGLVYFAGVAAVAAILIFEHVLVRDARHDGRSKHIGLAFFNANAFVSVAFLAFVALDAALAS